MPVNVDQLVRGSYLREEDGIITAAREIRHRAVSAFSGPLQSVLDDMSVPQPGDPLDPDRSPNCIVRNRSCELLPAGTPDQQVVVAITIEYENQTPKSLNVSGGTTTATVLTSWDSSGSRISITYDSQTYVGEIEIDESRPYLTIERIETGDPIAIKTSIENKVNAGTFGGLDQKCWKCSRVDYEPVRVTGDPSTSVYRFRYYLEGKPTRSIHLAPTGGTTDVYGWQSVEAVRVNGLIPSDATFVVSDVYSTADYDAFFGDII